MKSYEARERDRPLKRRRPKATPAGLWGTRVDALIRAMGWPQTEWRGHFGCSAQAVRRVRYGGRPRVAFIHRLRKLEAAYAQELEALAQGLIATRGRKRYCWIDPPRPPTRPADLQDLGQGLGAYQDRKTEDW